jgi:hypothetical protein
MEPLLVEARKVRATIVILAGNEQYSHKIMENLPNLRQTKKGNKNIESDIIKYQQHMPLTGLLLLIMANLVVTAASH